MHYIGYGIGWFLYCAAAHLSIAYIVLPRFSARKSLMVCSSFEAVFIPSLALLLLQCKYIIIENTLLVIGVVGPRFEFDFCGGDRACV